MSTVVGLKAAAFSLPLPHSTPVNVFGPKCMNPMNSSWWYASWRGLGRTFAAFLMISVGVSFGESLMACGGCTTFWADALKARRTMSRDSFFNMGITLVVVEVGILVFSDGLCIERHIIVIAI